MAVPKSPFRAAKTEGGRQYMYRKAAQYCHYTWEEFRDLPGYKQSEIVAFYWAETATEAILAHGR